MAFACNFHTRSDSLNTSYDGSIRFMCGDDIITITTCKSEAELGQQRGGPHDSSFTITMPHAIGRHSSKQDGCPPHYYCSNLRSLAGWEVIWGGISLQTCTKHSPTRIFHKSRLGATSRAEVLSERFPRGFLRHGFPPSLVGACPLEIRKHSNYPPGGRKFGLGENLCLLSADPLGGHQSV
jgi:hypothetical protein